MDYFHLYNFFSALYYYLLLRERKGKIENIHCNNFLFNITFTLMEEIVFIYELKAIFIRVSFSYPIYARSISIFYVCVRMCTCYILCNILVNKKIYIM